MGRSMAILTRMVAVMVQSMMFPLFGGFLLAWSLSLFILPSQILGWRFKKGLPTLSLGLAVLGAIRKVCGSAHFRLGYKRQRSGAPGEHQPQG